MGILWLNSPVAQIFHDKVIEMALNEDMKTTGKLSV